MTQFLKPSRSARTELRKVEGSDIEIECEFRKKFLVTKLILPIKGLANEFDGYKLLQLSDLHYGPPTSLKHLAAAVGIANSLEPDLIVMTGDYIQANRHGTGDTWGLLLGPTPARHRRHRRRVEKLAAELNTELSLLESRHGIVGVYGNHDIREGVRTIVRNLRPDIIWLKNNSIRLRIGSGELQIVGLDDYRLGKIDLPHALQTTKQILDLGDQSEATRECTCKILLSHNPDFVITANPHLLTGFNLALCGHTHGGQICLPGGRPIITRAKQRKHNRGLSFEQRLPIYVANGVGYGGVGIRSFCPPELTLVTLVRI